MESKHQNGSYLASDVTFIETPPAPARTMDLGSDCGVRITNVSRVPSAFRLLSFALYLLPPEALGPLRVY